MSQVYDSIAVLPLYNFIEITVTSDLKWLVKEGNVPDNIEDVWAEIFSQYEEQSSDGSVSKGLKTTIDLAYLTNKIIQVKNVVQYLRVQRSELLIEALRNKFGYKLKYADLTKDLDRTLTLLKSDELKVIKLTAEYEKLSTQAGMTREDYNDILVSLAKYMGFMPNKHQITVSEYLSMIKDFKRNNKPNGR